MKRIGRYTLRLENCPFVESYAAVVGKKESEGPAGVYFDRYYTDTTLGESSWEKAESRLQTEAVELALQKKGAECLTNAVYFCRRFAQPMHFFHLWAAQLTNPVFRAIRGLLHDVPDPGHGVGICGRRCGGTGSCGDFVAFLYGGAAIPPASGVRGPAPSYRAVDGHCCRCSGGIGLEEYKERKFHRFCKDCGKYAGDRRSHRGTDCGFGD